jgi:hypothetical protein
MGERVFFSGSASFIKAPTLFPSPKGSHLLALSSLRTGRGEELFIFIITGLVPVIHVFPFL